LSGMATPPGGLRKLDRPWLVRTAFLEFGAWPEHRPPAERGQGVHNMLMLAVTATIHSLIAASQASPNDPLSQQVLARVANPLLTSAQFLIPAAVAISGIHKMMEHRESGGSFMVDMVTKGGGAILVLQLVKSISGVS